ncbi:MAG: cobalt-precorrin-4/precorrin-4 C(11)-methyltransferase [Methanomicrobiales archaeon]|jgi:precorrin-4/cobalt-precorrin-4 C11-methyltransferase|nr:cobalt-precorrin-4/precorrin-4 C(11)-methyltransferase [Methanomicrobiales archaeon]
MDPVFFVGAGPGDPDLITVRGRDLLARADLLVYTGSLINPALIDLSPAPIKQDSWGMDLPGIVDILERSWRDGLCVVRLHSGDPSFYGAIIEQIEVLHERGIPTVVVPGVSSMNAAAAALQIQLTLKGVSESVIITRPAGTTLEEDDIPALSSHAATMVIFLGSGKIAEIANKVRCAPSTPAAVVYHASWPDQKVLRGTVGTIAELAESAGIERSALLIIGGVLDPANPSHRRSDLYS